MKRPTKLLVVLATTLSTVAFAGAGWTYWSTTGNGSASATVGTVASPTNVQATSAVGTGAVGVTWSGVSAPNGVAADLGYWVQRSKDGGAYTNACNSSQASPLKPSTVSSCNEAGVADGSYTYKVTAVFRSWTAQSGASGAVTVSTDTTAPTLVAGSLQMFDTNGNGKVDRVTATFSENLAPYMADTAPWTLTNVPSGGTLGSVSVTGSVATLTIAEGSGAADTAVGTFRVALAANANGIRDAAGNQASFTATTPTDKAAPALTALQMLDNDTDGNVDRVTAAFSETLASYTAGNTPWTLANVPSGGSLATSGGVSVAGTVATLTVTEGGGAADTSVGSFTVTLASSATGIRDAAGNQAFFAATAPVDKAGPVLIALTDTTPGTITGTLQQNDLMTFTFSEAVSPTWSSPSSVTVTLDEGPGNPPATLDIPNLTNGAFSTGSRDYQANNKTTTFASSTLTVSGASITIKLGTPGGNGTPGTGSGQYTVAPSTTIKDAAGNVAAGSYTSAAGAQLF